VPRLTRRHLSRSRALPAALLVGALAIPAVTGCEAGFDAPTLAFHPAAGGAGAVSANGNVRISNAFVLGPALGGTLPAGGRAGVFVSISSATGDQLVSVSADGAHSVQITGGTVNIPANGATDLTGPTPHIVLMNLSAPLSGGGSVTMQFTFANAGAVTVDAPVEPQAYDYATYAQPAIASPSVSPSSTASLTRSTHSTHKKAKATPTPTP
jgi:periplasmic copper chaperone A